MFITRGMMHDKAYQHIKVKIIEEMVIDAFIEAKDKLNLTCCDSKNIVTLTDHIYEKIIYDDSDDEAIKRAKDILMRVQKRALYVCVAIKEFKVRLYHNRIKRIFSVEKFFAIIFFFPSG